MSTNNDWGQHITFGVWAVLSYLNKVLYDTLNIIHLTYQKKKKKTKKCNWKEGCCLIFLKETPLHKGCNKEKKQKKNYELNRIENIIMTFRMYKKKKKRERVSWKLWQVFLFGSKKKITRFYSFFLCFKYPCTLCTSTVSTYPFSHSDCNSFHFFVDTVFFLFFLSFYWLINC